VSPIARPKVRSHIARNYMKHQINCQFFWPNFTGFVTPNICTRSSVTLFWHPLRINLATEGWSADVHVSKRASII
jgi:hypothetical protein